MSYRPELLKLHMDDVKEMHGGKDIMVEVIQQDMRTLSMESVGGKKWRANGFFTKLPGLSVFVYNHTQHAACSATVFSTLEAFYDVVKCPLVLTCLDPEHDHSYLDPFFFNNECLLQHYRQDPRKDYPPPQTAD